MECLYLVRQEDAGLHAHHRKSSTIYSENVETKKKVILRQEGSGFTELQH
jgi:hypothetical protein